MFEPGDKVVYDGGDNCVFMVEPGTEGTVIEKSDIYKLGNIFDVSFPHDTIANFHQEVDERHLSLKED